MECSVISSFEGEYAFLSNFYNSEITLEGIIYPTVEHAFQAMKTLDIHKRKEIAKLQTPGMSKRAGRHVVLRDDWEEVKFNIMKEALIQKFKNPILRQRLLHTRGAVLIEGNTWHDNVWGICTCDRCRTLTRPNTNNLGRLLMEIRIAIHEGEM